MKKLKHITALLLSLMLMLSVLPCAAYAQGPIDTDKDSHLTIQFLDEEQGIPGALFKAFKIADISQVSEFTLTADFAGYESTVAGLSDLASLEDDDWLPLAVTLKSYVERDKLSPAGTGTTDDNGEFTFELKPGIYLVIADKFMTEDADTKGGNSYTFTPFIVMLPSPDNDNNDWFYDMLVNPKSEKEIIPPPPVDNPMIERSVLKIWDDAGFESLRPAEIKVDLLCNGEVYETVSLNKDNNWSHTWELTAADEWSVAEYVEKPYKVTNSFAGTTFTITNTYELDIVDTDPPVVKKVVGETPEVPGTFKFLMTALDPANPMPEGSVDGQKEMTIIGAGKKEFGQMFFTKAGIYEYNITEENTGDKKYVYDTTSYTLHYEVVNNNGKLSYTLTIQDQSGNSAEACEFTNEYRPPEVPQTGLLWWPVPVLISAGLLCIIIGVNKRRRAE